MLEKSSSAAVRSGDWLARIVPKALIVLMALCVVLGGIWTFYNVKWSAQLTRQLEAWQAAGLPMSMSDVIPQPIPATQNAAPVYLQVFHVSFDPSSQASRSSSDLAGLSRDEVERLDDYRLGRERDKNAAAVRGILERPQVADTLAALKQASEYPKAVFPIKWQLGYSVILPHLAKFRSATRLVAVQAIVLAEDNRLEEALDWCLTGLRVADHAAQEPSLVAQLVATAMRDMIFGAIEEIISDHPLPSTTMQSLQQHLQGVDVYGSFDGGLRSEAAQGCSMFAQFRTDAQVVHDLMQDTIGHPALSHIWGVYCSWLGQPLRNFDEATFLRLMARQVQASGRPYLEAKAELDAIEPQLREARMAMLSAMIVPVYARVYSKRDASVTRVDLCRIALALKSYKSHHGQYPQNLAQLQHELPWTLPKDVFSGRDFIYRRQAEGFLIYSVGPDFDDDGGAKYQWDTRNGDILWTAQS